MTKVTLSDVGSLIDATTAKTTINANSAVIETAFDNTLSRNGTAPNAMAADLDMNSNQVINLPAATLDTEPVRKVEFDAAINNLTGGSLTIASQGVVVSLPAFGVTTRTITGTSGEVTVTNGSGVGGNPTVSLPSSITLTGKTIVDPTISHVDDLTKKLKFATSGITTGTTRTLTVPDTSGTITLDKSTRTLKDGSGFALTSADFDKTIIVDTSGTVPQGQISVTLPVASTANGKTITIKKMNGIVHAGKVVVTTPVAVSATGTAPASSTTLTLSPGAGAGIDVGMLVVQPDTSAGSYRWYPGIQPNTYVTARVGNIVTLSKSTVTAVNTTINAVVASCLFYTDTIDGGGPRAFEIPGQEITLVSDGVSNWQITNITMASNGSPIYGHHTVGSPFTVANPWPGDASTAIGQMWEFVPEAAGSNIRANMPHPNLLAEGYTPATINLTRSDMPVSYLPLMYTTNATWDQADSNTYPFVIDGYGDSMEVYTDGGEYRTLKYNSLHMSEINCAIISSTTTARASNTIDTPTNTIYAVPYRGFRIALPRSTNTTNYTWQVRNMLAPVSHLLSASTYGYAATNNTSHNVYMWAAPNGSLQLFLGASAAGAGEYTTLEGVRVNASALAGGVNAKSARWMATINIDGSGNVSYISDDRIPYNEYTGRLAINTVPGGTAASTLRIAPAFADGYSGIELNASASILNLNTLTTGSVLKTTTAHPIDIGTTNTTRWTFPAAGGLFSANATGGAPGIDKINAKGYLIDNNNIVGNLPGVTDGSNASAGNVGEYISASTGSASGPTVTMTIASPCVVTWPSNPFLFTGTGTASLYFTTTGALPTGITANTTYFVISSSVSGNTFQIATSVDNAIAGTAINTSGSQSGTHTGRNGTANLTTSTSQDFAGIRLTAGDWDIAVGTDFTGGATTTTGPLVNSASTISTTLQQVPGQYGKVSGLTTPFASGGSYLINNSGMYRLSTASPVTIYGVAFAVFSVSTCGVSVGNLSARRRR